MAVGRLDCRLGVFVEERSSASTYFSSTVSGAIAGRAKCLMPCAHVYDRGPFVSGLCRTAPAFGTAFSLRAFAALWKLGGMSAPRQLARSHRLRLCL